MEKMKRKSMGYSKKKSVCSNCDDILKNKDSNTYSCNKMENVENLVQLYGSCRYHSAKELGNILKNTRDGQVPKEDEIEKRERIILNQLIRSIFEDER